VFLVTEHEVIFSAHLYHLSALSQVEASVLATFFSRLIQMVLSVTFAWHF
jgi:hypothetical protein